MGVSGVTATKKEGTTDEPKGEKESIIVSPSPKKAMPPLRIAAVGKTNGPPSSSSLDFMHAFFRDVDFDARFLERKRENFA